MDVPVPYLPMEDNQAISFLIYSVYISFTKFAEFKTKIFIIMYSKCKRHFDIQFVIYSMHQIT